MRAFKLLFAAMLAIAACKGPVGAESAIMEGGVTFIDVDSTIEILDTIGKGPSDVLLNYVDSMYVVTLEINGKEESMIKNIERIFCDQDRIVVVDGMQSNFPIKIFGMDGKLQASIRQGQGPDDVLQYSKYTYNYDTHQLVAFNENQVKKFGLDGKLQSFSQYEGRKIMLLEYVDNRYVAKPWGRDDSDFGDCKILIMDTAFNVLNGLDPNAVDSQSFSSNALTLFRSDDSFLSSDIYGDTIYEYRDTALVNRYILRSSNQEVYQKSSDSQNPCGFPKGDKFIYFIDFFGFQQITIVHKQFERMLCFFRCKSTGNVLPISNMLFSPVLTGCPGKQVFVSYFKSDLSDGYMKSTFDLMRGNPKMKNCLPVIENFNYCNDNPIIVFFRLREF